MDTADVWYEIPDLADQVAKKVAPATIKATYSAGPTLAEQTGHAYELWIGIYNSAFIGGPWSDMEAVAGRIAADAAAWLRVKELDIPATTILVQFGDAMQLGPLSWSNALETFRFEVSSLREVCRIPSARDDPFRKMRYRLSGRREP